MESILHLLGGKPLNFQPINQIDPLQGFMEVLKRVTVVVKMKSRLEGCVKPLGIVSRNDCWKFVS